MRKTNLFYNEGLDSKFLTFSNYTESLTGNFLSTDTKLFPSRFLCLYIENLDKADFINNYLIGYYENKLSILRDKCIYNNENPEKYITPLAYLLKCISMYNSNFEINYIGDITEQDFNGTYTDTICIIDFDNYYVPNSIEESIDNGPIKQAEIINMNCLYGWHKTDLCTYFGNVNNIPNVLGDENNIYYYHETQFGKIKLKSGHDLTDTNTHLNTIKFNVIIPLYDITNMNYHTNETILGKDTEIDLTRGGDSYRTNVPLGIWFSDTDVELSKDVRTGFTQNWSLVISSQFKPFPYAKMQVNEPNSYSNSNAFPTFAMVLAKQNEVIDKFTHLERMIIEQNKKINEIETSIKQTETVSNIDNIRKDMIKYEYDITSKFNKFKQDVNDIINNLRWKGSE